MAAFFYSTPTSPPPGGSTTVYRGRAPPRLAQVGTGGGELAENRCCLFSFFSSQVFCSRLLFSLARQDGLPLGDRHASPVVAVMVVEGHSGVTTQRTSQGDAKSFQVVSVDELGEVRTWTAVFLARPSTSGSLDDLGG
jgi:hypothetical protein